MRCYVSSVHMQACALVPQPTSIFCIALGAEGPMHSDASGGGRSMVLTMCKRLLVLAGHPNRELWPFSSCHPASGNPFPPPPP